MIRVAVQAEDIDVAGELARLETLGGGGVASFTGIVRGAGDLVELLLEHYPAMTEAAMQAVADRAAGRWPLLGLALVHRHGSLAPSDRIVFVGTASLHRAAALESCAFLIDWLKTQAPFWKRERFANGTTRWIAQREDDTAAAARWDDR